MRNFSGWNAVCDAEENSTDSCLCPTPYTTDDTNAKDGSNQGEERKDGKKDGGGKKDASI